MREKTNKHRDKKSKRRRRERERKRKKKKKNMLYVVGQEIQDNMISLFNERKEKYEDDFLDNNY